jgi:hypothetical protein
MFHEEIRIKIEEELARGEMARSQGLEGRARVCARRAASVAARAYLEESGLPMPGSGAVDLLNALEGLPGISAPAHQAAARLLMRVDENYALPPDVDLLAEARLLTVELDNAGSSGSGLEDRNTSSGEGND